MRYLFAHKDNFEQVFIPFSICMMRLVCEVAIEITEVFTTYVLNDELWIVMCYSAFTCISYIDTQYFDTMDDKLKDKMVGQYQFSLKIENEEEFEETKIKNLVNKKFNCKEKFYYGLLIIIEFLYETVYFYFFPYFAIVFASSVL